MKLAKIETTLNDGLMYSTKYLVVPQNITEKALIRKAKRLHNIKARHRKQSGIGPDGIDYFYLSFIGLDQSLVIRIT
jgi:hypothetical protein